MELTDTPESGGWKYTGRNAKGEAKYKKYTHQTLEHVKQYLDSLDICYRVCESAPIVFIYRDKEPKSVYSSRYSYYYTTGRWGNDRRNKHYHANSIEHFMQTYYTSSEQQDAWNEKEKRMKGEMNES